MPFTISLTSEEEILCKWHFYQVFPTDNRKLCVFQYARLTEMLLQLIGSWLNLYFSQSAFKFHVGLKTSLKWAYLHLQCIQLYWKVFRKLSLVLIIAPPGFVVIPMHTKIVWIFAVFIFHDFSFLNPNMLWNRCFDLFLFVKKTQILSGCFGNSKFNA